MVYEHHKDDADLWASFCKGDKNAYSIIYHRFAQEMFSYGLRHCHDYNLIEDAIHDVFVKLYANRKRLPQVDNIKYYLYITLRNYLYNKHKEGVTTRFVDLDTTHLLADSSFIDDNHADPYNLQDQDLFHIIDTILPPRQKKAVHYRYIEQLSYQEIAELMGISVQSVKNSIQKAIYKLRAYISGAPLIIFILNVASTLFD